MLGQEPQPKHFLLMCCPGQGHINPTLVLATRIIRTGAQVTFATTVHGLRSIKSLPPLPGLSYASFSDGFDDRNKPCDDPCHVMSELERVGSLTLSKLLRDLDADGRQVSFLIYSLLLPWAGRVAREHHVPSAFLCAQSASVFAIYHRFFHNADPRTISRSGIPDLIDTGIAESFSNSSFCHSYNEEKYSEFNADLVQNLETCSDLVSDPTGGRTVESSPNPSRFKTGKDSVQDHKTRSEPISLSPSPNLENLPDSIEIEGLPRFEPHSDPTGKRTTESSPNPPRCETGKDPVQDHKTRSEPIMLSPSLNLGNLPDSVEIEGLPRFEPRDLPSFLLPASPHASVVPTILDHVRVLEQDPDPCVLLNSFDSLEEHAIKAAGSLNLIPIGPLIDPNRSGHSLKCELFEQSRDCLQWLSSKPDGSVVYVSFGSMAVLQRKQIEELFWGLVDTRRPFLWVSREAEDSIPAEVRLEKEESEMMLIVPWCSQVEVLGHRAVGAFVSHCGWNSTLEGMVAGVPVVACPQFSDQMTNAKLIEEVWRVGVRARAAGDDMVVERGEVERCVEMVMGGAETRDEILRSCMKWKGLAMEALEEGSGSSFKNLQLFMQHLKS